MRKILGTSLIAILSATPMLANATGERNIDYINATGPNTASSRLATTTYVQGAFVAAADKIDALLLDTAAVEGKYVKSGMTVSANLDALDGQVRANADDIDTMSGNITTMSDNIDTMSSDIATMSDDIDTMSDDIDSISGNLTMLMGGENVDGSIAQQIKTAVEAVDPSGLSADVAGNTDAIADIKAKEIKYMDTWNSNSPKSIKIEDLQ